MDALEKLTGMVAEAVHEETGREDELANWRFAKSRVLRYLRQEEVAIEDADKYLTATYSLPVHASYIIDQAVPMSMVA